MSTQSFKADSTFWNRYQWAFVHALFFALLFGWLYYKHSPLWVWVVAIAIGAIALWGDYRRVSWGDEVVFEGDTILIRKQGTTRHSIDRQNMQTIMKNKNGLVIARRDGPARIVMIGRESFLPDTYSKLEGLATSFAPAEAGRDAGA